MPAAVARDLRQLTSPEKAGLFLLAGTVGSGRSTLMASLVNDSMSRRPPGPKMHVIGARLGGKGPRKPTGTEADTGVAPPLCPEVLAVGEVRDDASAQGVRAAVDAGMSVFSTLYCALERVPERLEDFPSLATSPHLKGWAGCKLVALLCPSCAQPTGHGKRRNAGPGCHECVGVGSPVASWWWTCGAWPMARPPTSRTSGIRRWTWSTAATRIATRWKKSWGHSQACSPFRQGGPGLVEWCMRSLPARPSPNALAALATGILRDWLQANPTLTYANLVALNDRVALNATMIGFHKVCLEHGLPVELVRIDCTTHPFPRKAPAAQEPGYRYEKTYVVQAGSTVLGMGLSHDGTKGILQDFDSLAGAIAHAQASAYPSPELGSVFLEHARATRLARPPAAVLPVMWASFRTIAAPRVAQWRAAHLADTLPEAPRRPTGPRF